MTRTMTNNKIMSNEWKGSLSLESLHWNAIFPQSLAEQEPRKAYFLAKKGLKSIADVITDHVTYCTSMT